MFSYLRPHHRRTPSNPTSPAEQSHSIEAPLLLDHAHPQRHQDGSPPEPPAKTSPPPYLPPITRVSSAEFGVDNLRARVFERDPRFQHWDPASKNNTNTRSRDIYSSNNHLSLPNAAIQRPGSAGNAGQPSFTNTQYTRPQTSTIQEARPKPNYTFGAAQDSQSKTTQASRRPTEKKVPSPPPAPYQNHDAVQPRSGKGRLNLLNPMSLLARRRTANTITQLSPEALGASRSESNFDPRIRGTVVHDFSAPRPPPRRNVSYNDVRTEENTGNAARQFQKSPNGELNNADHEPTSPWSGGNHTPVFTENFEEEQYPAAGPHVRKASDLTDLPLPKPPYAQGVQKPIESNSTSKSNEASQKQLPNPRKISARKPVSDVPPPVPTKSVRRLSLEPSSTPQTSVPSKKGRSRNVSDVSARDPAIPKHMKSTSSRFSFDMIGAAEQERLLEDRHRQKALERKAENADDDERLEEFDDDFDYDNMDDDDGLEERIPGVNADLEEEIYEEEIPGVNAESEDDAYEEPIPGVNADLDEEDPYDIVGSGNLGAFTFQQSMLPSPLSPSSPGMVSTPRDANGEVIGFAMTKNSPHVAQDPTKPPISPSVPETSITSTDATIQGLGLEGLVTEHATSAPTRSPPNIPVEASEFPPAAAMDDDDLYFDDGIIGDIDDGDDAVEFDESVFDNIDTDEYGRPLKSLPSLPTLYSPPMLTADPSPSFNKIAESSNTSKDTSDRVSPGTIPPFGSLAPQASILEHSKPGQPPGLTQDSLAAYQSALAEAAYAAAAKGKFRRDSVATNPTSSEQEDSHPGLIPDSSHTSHYEPFSPNYELEDDFDYEDALEDDAIIAAANAEALANDAEGFYGQEFGFYSAPAATEAEYANGGYFGPRGVEGVIRSQSGRIASREPNLTPITERSEYSNRNSFMSPSMYGPGSVSSPGLAQLAGMLRSPDYEGEMSLDALLKLRRGAWGGSQASLHSSTGSPKSLDDASPVGQLPPWAHGGPVGNSGHWRKNSGFSLGGVSEDVSGLQSENENEEDDVTMSVSVPTLPQEGKDKEKEKDGNKGKRHRYTGSSESISYSKEDDPVSGERWVMERRRTGESGEVELLGREIVSGGRI
jgi:hypothetical protein